MRLALSPILLKNSNFILGIKHVFCSAHNFESNGALERSRGTIKEYLKYFVNLSKDNWDLFLPLSTLRK